MTNYQLAETENEGDSVFPEGSPLLNHLLKLRGIDSSEAAAEFLDPDYDTQLHNPLLLHDMPAAVSRIKTAVDKGEKIAIFSDYDCDGIPGAVVLYDLFKALGYDNFINYIPHRHFEGFGLSQEAVIKLKKEGVSLIITIDCGTTNVEEVALAKENGIDVIVTDHHEPEAKLPEAAAVVNPKLGDYPFPDLCGAAVAFKLAQALLAETEHTLKPGWEKWWLDMVGVATVADMVPLVGENRVLAHYGLKVLRKSRRPGLQQLLKKARADQRYLNEEDIGFTIGPRINAASRMDSPEDAFFMLAESNLEAAGKRVEHLEKLNTKRKTEVALMTKDIHKRLQSLPEIPPVIVMGHNDWRPSLVGLAANKLAEENNRPVFLWGKDGNGVYKGSCRSGGSTSVVKLMQAVSEIFLEYGGHHASGGFSVKEEYIFTLAERLNQAMMELGDKLKEKEELLVDAKLKLTEVNQRLVSELNRLGPFGVGNRKPLFLFKDVIPQRVEIFGKSKNHTKLVFQIDGERLEAIGFFKLPEQFTNEPKSETACSLLAHVEESFFMGRRQIRLRLVDVV